MHLEAICLPLALKLDTLYKDGEVGTPPMVEAVVQEAADQLKNLDLSNQELSAQLAQMQTVLFRMQDKLAAKVP